MTDCVADTSPAVVEELARRQATHKSVKTSATAAELHLTTAATLRALSTKLQAVEKGQGDAYDPSFAEEIARLSQAATGDTLQDGGRYHGAEESGWHSNLTECGHGDVGEYTHRPDGEFIEALWNGYRSGQLVPRAALKGTDQ